MAMCCASSRQCASPGLMPTSCFKCSTWRSASCKTLTRRRALKWLVLSPVGIAALRAARAATGRELAVGATATGVPFTFMDLRKRQLTGAMVDIVQAIGEDASFGVRLELMPFAALLPALSSGKIDMIAAAMLRTKAREQIVD